MHLKDVRFPQHPGGSGLTGHDNIADMKSGAKLISMRFGLILSIALLIVGCGSTGSTIPEIARGLPSTYSEGERIFDARLKARFPVGTEAHVLVEVLQKQGFLISSQSSGGGATYTDKGFLVSNVWNIGWKAQDGRIIDVWGIYGGRGP